MLRKMLLGFALCFIPSKMDAAQCDSKDCACIQGRADIEQENCTTETQQCTTCEIERDAALAADLAWRISQCDATADTEKSRCDSLYDCDGCEGEPACIANCAKSKRECRQNALSNQATCLARERRKPQTPKECPVCGYKVISCANAREHNKEAKMCRDKKLDDKIGDIGGSK